MSPEIYLIKKSRKTPKPDLDPADDKIQLDTIPKAAPALGRQRPNPAGIRHLEGCAAASIPGKFRNAPDCGTAPGRYDRGAHSQIIIRLPSEAIDNALAMEMRLKIENRSLVLDLVAWIAKRPKPYGEVMAAWRTSCPRLAIWEDALDNGFLVRHRKDADGAMVEITDKGRQFLAKNGRI